MKDIRSPLDDIIARGTIPDWVPLIREIQKDPFGVIADKTINVCENHQVYGSTRYFELLVQTCRDEHKPNTSKKIAM